MPVWATLDTVDDTRGRVIQLNLIHLVAVTCTVLFTSDEVVKQQQLPRVH